MESEHNALQEIEIRRNVTGVVGWRIRTNAPTRYIVNPNSGILNEKTPITNVILIIHLRMCLENFYVNLNLYFKKFLG